MSEADEPFKTLAMRWFKKAENDLLNVRNNLDAERYSTDTVCFHCQQAAEKYLKGFLAWHQIPFAKTHDLAALLQQLKDLVGEEANHLLSSILLLDDYSVSIRYPQEYESEPDEEEVREALQAAMTVRAWVQSRVLRGDSTDLDSTNTHTSPPAD